MGCISSKQGSLEINPDKPGVTRRDKPLLTVLPRKDYYDRHRGRRSASTPIAAPTPLPKAEDAKTEEEKEVLHIETLDLLIAENSKAHNTDKYEITEEREEDGKTLPAHLVVRRGEPFDMLFRFDRDFDKEKDDLRLIFEVGHRPQLSKGTSVSLALSDDDKIREWGAKIMKQTDKELRIRVFTPPTLAVAKWTFKVDVISKKDDKENMFRYTHQQNIYILFNPWCQDDQVYLDDESSRQEYVLNDKGRIYRGNRKQISAKAWNYGQFEDFMLDCCMHLLDLSELTFRLRGSPVFVTRKIAMLTNAPDDGGVLRGNWSGDYVKGTSPLNWIGSVGVLEHFYKEKQSVSFGQCWVFAGVVTTICRALGIPCRPVTNFASAHDCDGSITIDMHWSHKGEPMLDHNEDSVWNFHVWNDVWMSRPDLPAGFGGWQAIDATPQETSEGVYVTGPASVEAIKSGLVHLPYDAPFVFAEVNADKVHWILTEDGTWSHVLQKYSIGKHLSTKAPNADKRMDITYMYKFPEGSNQERTAVWRAAKEGSCRKDIYSVQEEDVKIELVAKEDTLMGQNFDVIAKMKNSCNDSRTLKIKLSTNIVFYTGVAGKDIKSEQFTTTIPANTDGEVKMSVRTEDYLDKLVDMANIRIHCMAQVVESKQWSCQSDDFRLLKPDLEVKIPEEAKVGEEFEAALSFTNPLQRSLTKCEFEVEGAGLQKPLKFKHGSVAPGSKAELSVKLKARRIGEKELVATFDSKELSDVHGSAVITIKPAEPAESS